MASNFDYLPGELKVAPRALKCADCGAAIPAGRPYWKGLYNVTECMACAKAEADRRGAEIAARGPAPEMFGETVEEALRRLPRIPRR